MTQKIEITKLRNVAGYEYTCACCGREIKNVFQVGSKTYGSECVINLFGAYGEKKVKDQMFLAKKFNGISEATKKDTMEILKINEDQYFTRFITTGQA
jgi:hypothetical protein